MGSHQSVGTDSKITSEPRISPHASHAVEWSRVKIPNSTAPSLLHIMKLLSILSSATTVCTLLLAATTVSVTAQQSNPFPLPHTNCATSSGSQILSNLGMSGIAFTGSEVILAVTISYESSEVISGGKWNVNASGPHSESGQSWFREYSYSLGSIFALPINENLIHYVSTTFVGQQGQNNWTVTAFDQNGEELTCFQFVYDTDSILVATVEKNNNKHPDKRKHIAASAAPLAASTRSNSSPRRRRRHTTQRRSQIHQRHRAPHLTTKHV